MKYSRQRQLIFDYLKSTKEHPTADVIYKKLKPEHHSLSLGTVYRNLSLLSETGAIRRLTVESSPDRFDFNIQPHYHAVCKDCGAVVDVKMEPLIGLDSLAREQSGLPIEGHDLIFTFCCDECAQKG